MSVAGVQTRNSFFHRTCVKMIGIKFYLRNRITCKKLVLRPLDPNLSNCMLLTSSPFQLKDVHCRDQHTPHHTWSVTTATCSVLFASSFLWLWSGRSSTLWRVYPRCGFRYAVGTPELSEMPVSSRCFPPSHRFRTATGNTLLDMGAPRNVIPV